MKKIIILFFVAAAILSSGCSDTKEEAVETAKEVMTLPDKAEVISDLVKIRNEVNLYYSQKGYFPESLSGLNLELYCPVEDYVYDAEKGTVKHKDYSQL